MPIDSCESELFNIKINEVKGYALQNREKTPSTLEIVSKELNHFAAILHVYAGGLNFMK